MVRNSKIFHWESKDIRVGQKIKSVQINSASILCGAQLHKDYWNIFIFSQKLVLRVSQDGQLLKEWISMMFQTNPCGYSKLVSQGAWYTAKGISLIWASSAEKTPKMFLNIDIFHSTDKWEISNHFFDVFSGQDARIELNPFAVYQASCDTSLEYTWGSLEHFENPLF